MTYIETCGVEDFFTSEVVVFLKKFRFLWIRADPFQLEQSQAKIAGLATNAIPIIQTIEAHYVM
jgi:hypothetical protein